MAKSKRKTKKKAQAAGEGKLSRARKLRKGFLCSAFSAAALFGSFSSLTIKPQYDGRTQNSTLAAPSLGNSPADYSVPASANDNIPLLPPVVVKAPPRDLPATLTAFGAAAYLEPVDAENIPRNWTEMQADEKASLENKAAAQTYAAYLAKFDEYKGEKLEKMAVDVNTTVLKDVSYYSGFHSEKEPQPEYYWAPPVQTVMAKKGDCKAFGILQYEIMRHLGVPDSRLAVAFVNASGSRKITNHVVLLMNVAKKDAAPDIVVLNDGGPVVSDSLYSRPQGANAAWPKPYVFYFALNDSGVWETTLESTLRGPPLKKLIQDVLKNVPDFKLQRPATAAASAPPRAFSAKIPLRRGGLPPVR